MDTLTSAQRRAFRARAHALHPVVSIGQHGLTPAVLHEIDVALLAHELIKIRVFSNARDERAALLARICAELAAAPVQHLGKVLIVWRQAPEPESPEQSAQPPRRPTGTRARSAATFRDTPPAPEPRTRRQGMPAGKPGARPGASKTRSADASARRRRPSDVIAAGAAPGKRRAVTAGKAQDTRKRAPATTKGPFEPGKRSGAATAARRRRRQT
jgi:RNA-binding protein